MERAVLPIPYVSLENFVKISVKIFISKYFMLKNLKIKMY
jgi:hypothetical protein